MRSVARLGVEVVTATLLSTAGPVSAEERVCRGTLRAITVDNLRVPQEATCRLIGTLVKGTIKVERGATLKASGIRVIGNVQAENAQRVVVRDRSRIGGSIQIVQGGAAKIVRNKIVADILFDEQGGALVANCLPLADERSFATRRSSLCRLGQVVSFRR